MGLLCMPASGAHVHAVKGAGNTGEVCAARNSGLWRAQQVCAATNPRPDAVLVFCALGTVAFFYNFVALAFIQATSALAIMIAGNFKHVLLILMPLVLYDHDPSHALGWTHMIGISIFFLSLAWCTAIDVYNVWNAEEKPGSSAAAPTEASPLNREEQEGKGKVEGSTAWTVPCLPSAPPRTVTGDKAA